MQIRQWVQEIWASLEAELGLPAGKGQEFFTIIDGAVLALNGIGNLNNIDQG